ncbi:DNA primase (bacterial type) [Rubidibacter lacunae KORDI 51-2]|uniref:DNA primase (Bacterial type) n=1 Tax=Rubidibacter lacunae KORDI 51-2 TaxID=582515 RepID=U5DMH0_9CHRO|nr:plasmid replication protein, CyRepA1 family [Rubidibacter lacunae]ERN42871.1 DNA primase (bacterial type) [Rubidibacter lacunae KORDI 51-2]
MLAPVSLATDNLSLRLDPAAALADWKPFQRVPEAEAIAGGLGEIPLHWNLTPLRDKRPYRQGWQTEPPLKRSELAALVLHGQRCTSRSTGKPYTGFTSGYGLRLGDASGGLVAIDVDGASAEPLLQHLSGGNLPATTSWTSGKPGRRQLLYQIPETLQIALKEFRRATFTQYRDREGCDRHTAPGELLEIRYNRHQSALPPSRHPETGAYRWLRSPQDAPVAVAPEWLCDLLRREVETAALVVALPARDRQPTPIRRRDGLLGSTKPGGLEELLQTSIARLSVDEIYSWPGHQFRDCGKTLRGFCPQHQSQSGTAFAVDPETKEWYCFGCEVGGGPAQYRQFLRGDRGPLQGRAFADSVRELAAEAGLTQPQGNAIGLLPDRAAQTWQRSQQFTPTATIEQPFFDWPVPPSGAFVAVKSGLGTGKTAWLGRVVDRLGDEGWVALGHRNSLLLQSCERWGFEHLHVDDAFDRVGKSTSKIALCVDSLLHFRAEDFVDKNVILDEAMAIALHLLVGGTLKRKREAVLRRFGAALARARRVFCLDGMLADWCVDYLHRIAGSTRELIKIENGHPTPPLTVDLLAGNWDGTGSGDRSALLQKLWASPQPVVCTDSQLEAEALDRVLQSAGSIGLRVDSKTICEPDVQEFLRDPDRFIGERQPEYLIYTPSAEAGIDIDIRDYFSDQFCFFFGVLQTNAQLQMIGRIRDPQVKRWVWCRGSGLREGDGDRSPFPQQIARKLEEFVLQEGLNLLEDATDPDAIARLVQQLASAREDAHHQAFCILKAIENYERARLRDCLQASLAAAGHRVRAIVLDPVASVSESERSARECIKTANAEAIFNAPLLSAPLPRQRSSLQVPPAERNSAVKTHLLHLLPGIERSPQWTPGFVRRVQFDDRQFVLRQELFWLVTHPASARELLQVNIPVPGTLAFLGDLRSRWSQVRALTDLGVDSLLDLEAEWTANSPQLRLLVAHCRSREQRLALGLGRSESDPIRCLRRLLQVLGIRLERRRVKRNRDRFEIYRIDRHAWYDSDRLAVLDCLDRRWLHDP